MKIIICGAGIAGLALARGLTRGGDEVVIVERSSGPRGQGYMIDFFGPGYDAADRMGVLDQLADRAYPIDQVRFVNREGRQTATQQYAPLKDAVGGKLMSLMRPDLEDVLRRSLGPNVTLCWQTEITSVINHPDGVRVRLSDGRELEADLLVGADGIHSATRRMVFGPESDCLRPLGFHTAAWVFEDAELRDRLGDRWVMTDTVDAEVGLYGLNGNAVAAFGVHRTDQVGLPADPQRAVHEAYGDLGWLAAWAVANCPAADQLYFDIVAQVEVPQWHTGRVVLIGDACQAVSLIAGQGASLAVAGAELLAGLLSSGDACEAAAEYVRRWRPFVEEKQRVGRSAARWFIPGGRAALLARRLILNASWVPGINRLIAYGIAGKSSAVLAPSGARVS